MAKNKLGDLVREYVRANPNMPNMSLAKLFCSEHQSYDVEHIRARIRQVKGASGDKLRSRANKELFTPESMKKSYLLPTSFMDSYEPFILPADLKRGLIMSDIHVPYQNNNAIELALEHSYKKDIDFIILNGDIADQYMNSFFSKLKPIDFKQEIEMTKQFLNFLKQEFPKTKIYYKFGNHEDRFQSVIARSAPQFLGIEEFRLDVLLDLFNIGIQYVSSEKYIRLKSLNIIHGHEYGAGAFSPVNPARSLYLKTKSSTLCGHFHQTSEQTETDINGKVVSCWSIGCMSELHPQYRPLNKWNLGFAMWENIGDDGYIVSNHRIIKNRVV